MSTEENFADAEGAGTDTQGMDLEDIESAALIVGSCGYSELSDRLRAHAATKPERILELEEKIEFLMDQLVSAEKIIASLEEEIGYARGAK